jgi:hypothetical protein
MTLTKRKKQVKEERKICNPQEICFACGISIKNGSHHFFCSNCYKPGLMYTEEIRKKLKEIRDKEMKKNARL